jgi:hypothetical protein
MPQLSLRRALPATLLAFAALSSFLAAQQLPQKVLFAGSPDTDRSREFVALFEKHFAKVACVDYSQFEPSQADGFDVVVLDALVKPTPGRIGLPPSPKLPADFNRATVLIGGAGVMAVEPLSSKLDWL